MFAHRKSQDLAAKAIEAWAAEVLVVEWVTTTERGLEVPKAHQVEIEVAL